MDSFDTNEIDRSTLEQSHVMNRLLVEMVKNQRQNMQTVLKMFAAVVICYTFLLIVMIVSFFVREMQFETKTLTTETITTETTTTQEVSGENSEINNVEGNMYRDSAIHNQE